MPMDDPIKSGRKSGSEAIHFKPVNRAKPNGRPAGSRNKATVLLDQMAEGDATEILATVTTAAKAGDLRAAEILLSRIWPVRKGRPVALDLPALESAADVVSALSVVAAAMASGDITPEEAQAVAAVLEGKRRAVETVALEARIAVLEQERSDEAAR